MWRMVAAFLGLSQVVRDLRACCVSGVFGLCYAVQGTGRLHYTV